MLVLAAEYKEFVAFVQSRCVAYMEVPFSVCQVGDATTKRPIELEVLTHAHPRNVTIVVHQTPLMARQVQSQDMIVYFVSVLVKATESIDLVVPAIGHGCIDEARRPLSQRACDFGAVPINQGAGLERRVWHDVGIVGGRSRGWCLDGAHGV